MTIHVPSRKQHPLTDVQGSADHRNVPIDKVGVCDITYPIRLRTRDGGVQHTVATVNMFVSLPHHQKGTHMSRFLEVLNDHCEEIDPTDIMAVCHDIREKLEAEDAHLELEFEYFVRKSAPKTGSPGLMNYRARFECTANHVDDFVLGVRVPATSLCPCSKEISEYGAHNQRCEIEAKVRIDGMLWIEELVEMVESAASAQVFAVLKRPDEKFVTEDAYDNPRFVEDIVRDLSLRLEDEPRIRWYAINSKNYESIHNHSAYAYLERDKRDADD
ncbi:MAG: GTP cyclohydrolase I FolE2 [Planctomycetaceae bacterium]|nr:GTP cyclohydrolase I FolE2 [Planctomycetaceae bacterium]